MSRPSPTVSATKYKPGTIKKGNDGEDWIVATTKSGVHRWQKFKKVLELHKFKRFKIETHMSTLVGPPSKARLPNGREEGPSTFTINSDGVVNAHLKSKYLPKFNNKTISFKVNRRCRFMIVQDNYLLFEFPAGKERFLVSAFFPAKYKKELIADFSAASKLDILREQLKVSGHHYGDMRALSIKELARLKPGKYYIAWGQHIADDYTGKYSLGVLDFVKMYTNKTGFHNVVGKLYTPTGVWTDLTEDFSIISAFGGEPYPYSGNVAVYFISNWRKGFKPPSKLPKAKFVV